MNSVVLASGTEYFSDEQPINPFMDKDAVIDLGAARAEHEAIMAALQGVGVTVLRVAPPENCQDGVFTANWALVRGKKAVMARLPNARKNEEAYARQVLEARGLEAIVLPENLKFSGQGDALPCGDLLFCGSGYRSDEAAQKIAADTLGFRRVQLQTKPQLGNDGQPVVNAYSGLPDSFYYDIDLAISILKFPTETEKGLIAWCPEAFLPESVATMRALDEVDKIEISEEEAMQALCCNLVSTGTHVVMNAGAPLFTDALRAHGLTPILLSNPELAKGGGSMRCTTLTLV